MPNSLLKGILAALGGEDRAIRLIADRFRNILPIKVLTVVALCFYIPVFLNEDYLESVNLYLGAGGVVGQHLKGRNDTAAVRETIF